MIFQPMFDNFFYFVTFSGVLSYIIKGPSNSLMKLGDTVQFVCTTGGKSCDDIDWSKTEGSQSAISFYKSGIGALNSDRFPPSRYVVTEGGVDGCTLNISDLSLADSGIYGCSEARGVDEFKGDFVLVVFGMLMSL